MAIKRTRNSGLAVPELVKPTQGGSQDVWGSLLNSNIDKQSEFYTKLVQDSETQNQEIKRIDIEKVSTSDVPTIVEPIVDQFLETNGKPLLDNYMEETIKPSIDTYTSGKKAELDNYVNLTSKPSLDSYEKEKEAELDLYTTSKKGELDSHTLEKQTQLDSYEKTKETELDNYTIQKETQLNDYTIVKKGELDEHTTIKKSELDSYTTLKESELDSHTLVKKGELDTYEKEKEKELNTYTTTKKGELDSHTTAKKGELDAYEKTKETQLNQYTSTKQTQLDSYTNTKKRELDTHTNAKKGQLDTYTTEKEGELDTHTGKKKSELDAYEKTKEEELNTFTGTKKTEITNHTNTKKGELNTYTTQKKGEITTHTDSEIERINADSELANKANKTIQILAGNGLVGGGDLSTNRTLNVASADDGITVNADNIKLNIVDNATTDSATRAGSARQIKLLNDNKQNKTDNGLKTNKKNVIDAINSSLNMKERPASFDGTFIDFYNKFKIGSYAIPREVGYFDKFGFPDGTYDYGVLTVYETVEGALRIDFYTDEHGEKLTTTIYQFGLVQTRPEWQSKTFKDNVKWNLQLTDKSKLFLGTSGISSVTYIQDSGTKTEGNGYIDKVTGKLYLCKTTNEDVEVTNNFVLATTLNNANKLDNLWNSNFSFKRFSSKDFGFESGAYGYCCTIGKMGIVLFQYHGSGSSFTIKFPIQFVKEELYVSIVDNDAYLEKSAYSNTKIGWYSQTGYTGIKVDGASPGFTGFAIGAII